MKLLTHNFLSSRFLKDVKGGYPLKLSATQVKVTNVEFNEDFIKNLMPKIDYSALKGACDAIGQCGSLPATLPDNYIENHELLEELHKALCTIEVIEGELQCPDTGKVFMIRQGIPNLLQNDEE